MSFVEIEYKERELGWAMSELQSHDYYELYFLVEGKREFFFENKMFNVSAGTFCVIPPFAMHKTAGGSYKRVNINVSPDLLTQRERELLERLCSDVVFTLGQELYEPLFNLIIKGAGVNFADTGEKNAILLSFIHTALYMLEEARLSKLAYGAIAKEEKVDTHILEAVSYINESFREELTLDGISERFFISKNSLSARFKATMGCSVMQYVAFVRLSRAKELLSTTAKSIEEISELCGYSSANYFSLSFKKSVGISPMAYRKTK